MPKFQHWTDSIPLASLMLVSFFAGCLTATRFNDLEWETLVAGVLGLIGGSFAILAITRQRRAELAQRRMAFRLKLKAAVKNIQERVNYFLRPNI